MKSALDSSIGGNVEVIREEEDGTHHGKRLGVLYILTQPTHTVDRAGNGVRVAVCGSGCLGYALCFPCKIKEPGATDLFLF
jgi:hypothetical protein